ncbi:Carbon storage regulator [hydrothermal vent metagenome]|uniref:Carbon storage regulator n=1 Tax=hydrothermal vent metagenome TaxID=652676 RepID=A0A3B1CIS4_9ZZZZ
MLVLTRRSDESIRIGDDIIIRVVEVKGNQVRLGIEAPRHFRIYREELYQKISRENRLSAMAGLDAFGKLKEVFRKS